MMDESKTPPTHLGSCRYLTLYRGVLDLSIINTILYHEVPNPNLTIRNFFIAPPCPPRCTAPSITSLEGWVCAGVNQLSARQLSLITKPDTVINTRRYTAPLMTLAALAFFYLTSFTDPGCVISPLCVASPLCVPLAYVLPLPADSVFSATATASGSCTAAPALVGGKRHSPTAESALSAAAPWFYPLSHALSLPLSLLRRYITPANTAAVQHAFPADEAIYTSPLKHCDTCQGTAMQTLRIVRLGFGTS
jgi:hypothetical protein